MKSSGRVSRRSRHSILGARCTLQTGTRKKVARSCMLHQAYDAILFTFFFHLSRGDIPNLERIFALVAEFRYLSLIYQILKSPTPLHLLSTPFRTLSFITTMATEVHPSPPSTTGILTPPSESSAKCIRTSSMPDESRYTARLKKLGDRVPARRSAIVFTGADCSNMNRRISRLAPPKRIPFALPKLSKSPGYYGSDSRKHEKRTKRYLDGKHVTIKKGGPPVFSGSSGKMYEARMLRLQERH